MFLVVIVTSVELSGIWNTNIYVWLSFLDFYSIRSLFLLFDSVFITWCTNFDCHFISMLCHYAGIHFIFCYVWNRHIFCSSLDIYYRVVCFLFFRLSCCYKIDEILFIFLICFFIIFFCWKLMFSSVLITVIRQLSEI
jgi:hypothetical protein